MARLIFLTSTPTTVAGGSGTWVGISVLRDAIEALGHEVTLMDGSGTARGKPARSRLAFNLQARDLLRGLKADVLVGFDLDGVLVARGDFLHVAAIKGVLADEAHYEKGASRLGLVLLARLEGRHVRRCDRIITTSVYSAEQIARFYGASQDKIVVVPELIDLAAWTRSLETAAVVAGPSRILSVAHLYPRKGIATLLRAFAHVLRNTGQDAVLRIVGAGPERQRLDHLARDLGIADRVSFLGHLPLQELTAEYRNAALFALPTAQEGFGIVFLEAMASSLVVVAGRAGAVPEVVEEGVTALLVRPDDDRALAERLAELLENPVKRTAMGSAGRAQVLRYDAPVVARQFLNAVGVSSS
jgi:glycosyltransferase involved in cell wall biosynthesis